MLRVVCCVLCAVFFKICMDLSVVVLWILATETKSFGWTMPTMPEFVDVDAP